MTAMRQVGEPPGEGPRLSLPRFGQLTYTSFDGGGVGGWQIKDQCGLSAEEQELLRSRIDPQLDAGVELTRFPSPDEAAQFPRRLVFGPDDVDGGRPGLDGLKGRAVAWWHHAPAGVDGSGRPGNVFAHVLLDRSPVAAASSAGPRPAVIRPIDLWRSPGWLSPFGADAVRDAMLGPEPPQPGAAVSVKRVVAFLLDLAHYRLGVLGVLLDACAAALNGGPTVVLATESTDTAALWVASVTYLMSAFSAQRFGFSTLERATSVTRRFAQGVHLCCVPTIDYEPLSHSSRSYVLIAEDEPVAVGDLDGAAHVTGAGDQIIVTEWSILARVVLIDESSATWAISQLDRVANQVGNGLTDDLCWPLAMVIAALPDHFRDAVGEASRVLIRRSPSRLRQIPELLQSARSLIATSLGSTTADVWRALERLTVAEAAPTVMGEILLNIYVSRAFSDAQWLAQSGGPPVPKTLWSADGPPPELTVALDSAVGSLAKSPGDDPEAALSLAALANFSVRLGVVTPELLDGLSLGLERSFVHLLFTPGASALVARLGTFDEQTVDMVIRPLVNNALGLESRPLGRRLAADVLHWLYPLGVAHVLPLAYESFESYRLRGELAFQWVKSDPDRYSSERPLAVVAALEERADPRELAAFFAGVGWSPAELEEVERRFPGRLPLEFFGPTIKAAAAGEPLDDLCTAVLASRHNAEAYEPYGAGDLIRMRQAAGHSWWRSRQRFRSNLALMLSGGVHALRYPTSASTPTPWTISRRRWCWRLPWATPSTTWRSWPGPRRGRRVPARAGCSTSSGRASGRTWLSLRSSWRRCSEIPASRSRSWATRLRLGAQHPGRGQRRPCAGPEAVCGPGCPPGWTSFDQLAESVRELLWERLKQSDNRERAHRVCGKFAQSCGSSRCFPARACSGGSEEAPDEDVPVAAGKGCPLACSAAGGAAAERQPPATALSTR